MFEFFENRYIHEGPVVYQDFDDLVNVKSMFGHNGFECLLEINEQIVPRFILEFYSQYHVKYTLEGQMLIEFVIQDQFFFFTLEESGQILGIPYNGDCSFFDKWSLDYLASSIPTGGPYQINPPSPDEIKLYFQEERGDVVTRICHDKVIDVKENQILTRDITSVMKTWVGIIRENIFCLGGNWDHVPACLCHMLYCIARSEPYNLAFFVAKRMEFVTKQARLILLYGMLLARLFKHLRFENPKLSNDNHVLYDHVVLLLLLPPPSVNHPPLITLMMIMMEMTKKIKLTIISPRKLFVDLTKEDDGITTPSPITKSSSSSSPNAPSKTPSTKDTSSTFGTTSSSFKSKPHSLPTSSKDTPSPQPTNPFLVDTLDSPPRLSNQLPLQSHPSLDIILSLSPITSLDHILDTPSSPSPPPPPQPPIMGHPIYS
ncbi:hypothetical protein Tco_1265980 [Tanacetum coccineum]